MQDLAYFFLEQSTISSKFMHILSPPPEKKMTKK